MSESAEKLYRTIQREAARYDVLQDVLNEMEFRGVGRDNRAYSVVRTMRNTAKRHEDEARAKYAPLVHDAYRSARA